MSTVTVIWSMLAASCLMMAGIHLVVWCNRRNAWASLAGFLMAGATAALAFLELRMMHAGTVEELGMLQRWYHPPLWLMVLAMLLFVRLHLHAGRTWLAWVVAGTRTLALVLNFYFSPNLNFTQITALQPIPFLGDSVVIGDTVPNPWMLVAQASLFLWVVFVVDAGITVWRRKDDGSKRLLAGTIAFFAVAGSVHAVLMTWGIVNTPLVASAFFVGIVMSTCIDAGLGVLRSAQLSERLRESEERINLATSASGIGLWVWTIASDRIWCSPRWYALFDFPPHATVTREQIIERVHIDDRAMLQQALQRTLSDDEDYNVEFRVLTAQGRLRWIAASGQRSVDSHGRTIRVLGSVIDITRRMQATERFVQVVETSPNGILVSDRDRRISLVNTRTEQLFGYTREELLGQSIDMLVPEGARGEHANLHEKFFAEPSARAMGVGRTVFARRKDGTEFMVDVGLSPITSEPEFRVLVTIVDISERVQRDQELTQLRNELARMSRVTMLGELSGSLAHELNQPLTAILSNAQAAQRFLARDKPDLNELREILQDIAKEDRRAGDIIRRLRALLEKGEVQQQFIDLDEIIDEVMLLLRSDLALHHVRAYVETAAALPRAIGDRVQLQQVILNLVMNATEAMSDQPPADRLLTVRTALGADDSIEVSIQDAGPGIPRGKLEAVFDAFYTTKRHGMGLGLTVCRTIVAAHGGKLWATHNEEGPGATFHLRLRPAKT